MPQQIYTRMKIDNYVSESIIYITYCKNYITIKIFLLFFRKIDFLSSRDVCIYGMFLQIIISISLFVT